MNNNFWKDQRVFVTGASGMVGSWLVKELLKQEAYVVALIRDSDPQSELFRSRDIEKLSVVTGALEDYSTLERGINEYETEIVFHLAAQPIVTVAHRSPLPTFEANIRGTYNLLEACRRLQGIVKRVVIASSDKAYGTHDILPYTEDMPLHGIYPYEVSKSCTDLISQCYFHTYGLPVAIARCGNIFGGGDLNWSRLVPGTIRSFLAKERPIIRSDGSYIRDYLYVRDVAQAYMAMAEKLDDSKVQGQAFNFSSDAKLSVLELVSEIQKIMGCEKLNPDIKNIAQGEIRSQYLDASKAKNILGWKSKFSLQNGLSETITWYKNYLGSKI